MFRDLFVLVMTAVIAQVMLFSTYKPFWCMLSFGAASGAFSVSRLVERARPAWRDWKPARMLEFGLFQLCLVLLCLELGLRTVATVYPNPVLARDSSTVDTAMEMYKTEPGQLRYGFPCNSGRHFDEEFEPGEQTVVSIGDSFSMGIVPHWYHFTTVCERVSPGLAVHNLGRTGIGPGGYLRFLQTEGLGLDPDLILINIFVGNDIAESLRWNNPRGFLESWCDRRNVLTYQVPIRLARLAQSEGNQIAADESVGDLQDKTTQSVRTQSLDELTASMPWLEDPTLEPPRFSESEYSRIEGERANIIRRGEMLGAYAHLTTAIDVMRDASGDTPFAVMLIPDEYQVSDRVWQTVRDGLGQETMERDRPQERIIAWLQEQGIPYLDLLPVFRAVSALPDGQRHLYHLRDTHINARGNRVVGEALAEFLNTQLR